MIRCGRQANVAGKFEFVSKTRNKRNDRARHICVDQKAHAFLSGGKWVKRLLLGKLADESERRSNIINSQIVLALNFFEGHPPGEAPNHDRHWNTRATNDGFPVADSRVDNDAVLSLHADSNITGFAQLSRFQFVRVVVCQTKSLPDPCMCRYRITSAGRLIDSAGNDLEPDGYITF